MLGSGLGDRRANPCNLASQGEVKLLFLECVKLLVPTTRGDGDELVTMVPLVDKPDRELFSIGLLLPLQDSVYYHKSLADTLSDELQRQLRTTEQTEQGEDDSEHEQEGEGGAAVETGAAKAKAKGAAKAKASESEPPKAKGKAEKAKPKCKGKEFRWQRKVFSTVSRQRGRRRKP